MRLFPVALVSLLALPARADTRSDRFGAGGYFRIMTRPDFQGGNSKLGLWNLYGRLLNEGPWAMLELKLDLLQATPGTREAWTSLHAKVEGGSVSGADPRGGSLEAFRLDHLYVKAGNVLVDSVTWQVGTLEYRYGDLGLYDEQYIAQLFGDTVGMSATWSSGPVDLFFAGGDAGYTLRGERYSTVLAGGLGVRLRLGSSVELGAGGEVFHEPAVDGNRNAPHQTPLPPNASYADFRRGEIVDRWLEANPDLAAVFPAPVARSNTSYRGVGYIGFGKLGVLRWNNLFAKYERRHPDTFVTEQEGGRVYTIYVAELTDERDYVLVGDEMQLELVPERLDVVWAALYGRQLDHDNTIFAGEDNREFWSTVLRLQLYLAPTVHILAEGSMAKEKSLQGNLWREHHDSLFTSEDGRADSRGTEFGDTAVRSTWQLKAGLVLNPTGFGIWARPSLRVLYGLQHSNMHNAFGNSFSSTLEQYDTFRERRDRHWHQVLALETEVWF